MRKTYIQPTLDITGFAAEDILCTSTLLTDKFDMGDAVSGNLSSNIENWSYTEGDTNAIQVR